MTATTTRTSLTITPDTNPDELLGRAVRFTIEGAAGPFSKSGRFETAQHMDFGSGITGIGGTFVDDYRAKPGDTGRTSIFLPDGTFVVSCRR